MTKFQEFRNRLVFKVAVTYLTITWLIIQVIATLTPIYDMPGIFVRGIAFMLIGGYPIFVGMAWVYELTHKESRGWDGVNENMARNPAGNKFFYRIIFSIWFVCLSILLVDLFVLRAKGPSIIEQSAAAEPAVAVDHAGGSMAQSDASVNAVTREQLAQAKLLVADGQYQNAESIYRQSLDRFGASMPVLEAYAHLLASTGQFNEAIAMFKRARSITPLEPRLSYQLALLEMYRGRDNEMKNLASYGLSLDENHYLLNALSWELAIQHEQPALAALLIRGYFSDVDTGVARELPVSKTFMETVAAILAANDFERSAPTISELINNPGATPFELNTLARVVAVLGEPQIALEYWFGQPASPAIWGSLYDDMRRLPDFNRLLQEQGLVDYWRASRNWGDFCVAAGGRDFVCK